jgi:hypothetical protein
MEASMVAGVGLLDHMRWRMGESSSGQMGAPKAVHRASFTHLIRLYKGIRGFSETVGNEQVKAKNL